MLHNHRRVERQAHSKYSAQLALKEGKQVTPIYEPVNKKQHFTTELRNQWVVTEAAAPQISSDEIGIERDHSLNQALDDAKLYESFMQDLKQKHLNEHHQNQRQCSEPNFEDAQEVDEKEIEAESSPKNKIVHRLVQNCCNMIVLWRNTQQPQHQLSKKQVEELDECLELIQESLLFQNSQDLIIQSQQQGHIVENVQTLLARHRENKFSNRLTYDLPISEQQCKEEHNAIKELIRLNNKWLMRHQIKHKLRQVQDQLQKIKICHANRRRQRVHRKNKRQRRSGSFDQSEGEQLSYELDESNDVSKVKMADVYRRELDLFQDQGVKKNSASGELTPDSQKSEVKLLHGTTLRVQRLRKLSNFLQTLLSSSDEKPSQQIQTKVNSPAIISEDIDPNTFQNELSLEQNQKRHFGKIVAINSSEKVQPVQHSSSPESNFNQMIDDLNVNQKAQTQETDCGPNPLSTECTMPSPPDMSKELPKRHNEVIILCPQCQGTGFKVISMPTCINCRCHGVQYPVGCQSIQLGLQARDRIGSENKKRQQQNTIEKIDILTDQIKFIILNR